MMPQKHTGFGEDISQKLIITDVPEDQRIIYERKKDYLRGSCRAACYCINIGIQSLQTLNTQVWEEWAPNIKTMYEIGSSSLEIYSVMNPQNIV